MSVVARILLRYATGPLLMLGLILPDEQQALIADPAIVDVAATALGLLAAAAAEGCYALAKRFGWRT